MKKTHFPPPLLELLILKNAHKQIQNEFTSTCRDTMLTFISSVQEQGGGMFLNGEGGDDDGDDGGDDSDDGGGSAGGSDDENFRSCSSEGEAVKQERFHTAAGDGSVIVLSDTDNDDGVKVEGGGGDVSRVMQNGKVWEKAGVGVSVVYGTMPPEAYRAATGQALATKDNVSWWCCC